MSPYSVFCHAYLPSSHLALPDWLNIPVVMPFFCVCVCSWNHLWIQLHRCLSTSPPLTSSGSLSHCEGGAFSRQDLLALLSRLVPSWTSTGELGEDCSGFFAAQCSPSLEQDLPPGCRWRPGVFVFMIEGWRLGIRTHGSKCEQGCSTGLEKQGKNVGSPKNHCHFPDKYFLCCQGQLLFRRIMLCSCIWKQLLGTQPAAQLLNLPMKTLKKWGKFARKQVCNTARQTVSLLHASENLINIWKLHSKIHYAPRFTEPWRSRCWSN